eukprot:2265249-Prymnesium_polylepis.3
MCTASTRAMSSRLAFLRCSPRRVWAWPRAAPPPSAAARRSRLHLLAHLLPRGAGIAGGCLEFRGPRAVAYSAHKRHLLLRLERVESGSKHTARARDGAALRCGERPDHEGADRRRKEGEQRDGSDARHNYLFFYSVSQLETTTRVPRRRTLLVGIDEFSQTGFDRH